MKISKITRIFLLVTAICIILFDIVVALCGGAVSTISYQIWLLSKKFPFLQFALGTLMSHFFAPDWFSKKIPIIRYIIWIGLSCLMLLISIIFYPINLIHPFIVLIFGIGNGLFWSQKKLDK